MILKTLCFLYFVKCLLAEVKFHIEPSSPIVAVENATFFIKCIAEDTAGTINITTKFRADSHEIKTTPDNHIVVTTTYNGSKTIVELSISGIQAKDLYNQNKLYCATPNSDYQVDVIILPEQKVPKFVNDAPTTLSTVYGSDFSFSCSVFSEKYPVDIEWAFDGKLGSNIKYIPDASNKTFIRSKVIISDVKYSNGGKYSCIAKLSIDGFYVESYTKIFDLAEISAEKNQPSKEEVVKAGSDVTLVCDIAGYPAPKYVWKKFEAVIDNYTDSRYKFSKENESEYETLTINDVTYSDRAVYSCIVNFNHSQVVKEFTLRVRVSAEKNQPSKEEVVKAGSDVTLVCDIAGYPAPKYVWKKFEAVIDNYTDSRYKFSKENESEYETLTINDVTYSDRAVYSCIVNFNHSQVVKEFTLRVRDPLNALWPAVGILIEAVLLAIIIFSCEACKKSKQGEKNYKMKENEETSPLVGNSPTKIVYSGAEDSARLRSSKEIVT